MSRGAKNTPTSRSSARSSFQSSSSPGTVSSNRRSCCQDRVHILAVAASSRVIPTGQERAAVISARNNAAALQYWVGSGHFLQKPCCLIAHACKSCCRCVMWCIMQQSPDSRRRRGWSTNEGTPTDVPLLQPQPRCSTASLQPQGTAHLGLLSGSPRKRRTDSLRSLWGTCTRTRTAAGAGAGAGMAGRGARDVDAPKPVEGRGGLTGVATPRGPLVTGAHGSARGCFPTPEPAGRRVVHGRCCGLCCSAWTRASSH